MQSDLVAGIYTTGTREYFDDTRESLRRAGFADLHVFIDCKKDGAFPTWYRALTSLYVHDSQASRYVIFEDDLIAYSELRNKIAAMELQNDCYYNLYCCDQNKRDLVGWTEPRRYGRGAVALMFPNVIVFELLTSKDVLAHLDTEQRRRNTDGVINCFAHRRGIREMVHCPGLVEHVGAKSSIGH